MAGVVYILCALTSIACMLLLLRAYLAKRVRLLFWSALCFACFGVNNILLFIDLVLVPDISLVTPRNVTALLGVSLLLYGLIWDTRD